jgi:hypothetical protein
MLQIFTGWVLTLLLACAICSLFVALGVNSPNRQSIDQIIDAQEVRTRLPACLACLPAADPVACQLVCGGQATDAAAAACSLVLADGPAPALRR